MLKLVKGLFQVLRVLNIVAAFGFAGALLGTFAFGHVLLAQLHAKYGATIDAAAVIHGMRGMLLLGLISTGPAQILLTALIRMLRTVDAGNPFVAANAHRLHAIGWALLAIQLIDGAFGFVVHGIARAGADVGPGWSPAIAGWLAILLVFILARVFAQGAAMRDELEMTV
ncbi:MAG: DUF2975 domain-containing protein [Sphingomonas sp.]